jgi:molybdopterin-guanine dinucleotide biosynthesis protein A
VSPDEPLGAILAGGRNTRYGALKALESVGGVRIIDRVIDALGQITSSIVLIANDAAAYGSVGLRIRPDAQEGLGPLAGLYSALRWAEEEKRRGIFAVACDMPFVSVDLLRELTARSEANTVDVVAPESGSRRGLEPLCAYYSVRCLPAIGAALARADLRLIGFHGAVRVERVPLEIVQRFGDPDVLFLNVNTVEERERAERLLAERG